MVVLVPDVGCGSGSMSKNGDGGSADAPVAVSDGAAGAPADRPVADTPLVADARPPADSAALAADAARDVPAADGAVGDAATAACPFKLCEDFEEVADGQLPDPAIWQRAVSGGGTLEVVSTMARRGRKSLHIHTPAGPSETYLRETRTFPAPNNSFYGRLFFYFDRRPAAFVHWNVVEGRGTGNNNRIRYGGIANMTFGNWFLFNVQRLGANETGIDDDAKPPIPAQTWVCMEWMFNGTTSEARLWWDGVERPRMHVTGLDPQFAMPSFRELYLGWALYQNIEAGYEVWIDGIALDDQKIGCDR
jgi:hypothetical protein